MAGNSASTGSSTSTTAKKSPAASSSTTANNNKDSCSTTAASTPAPTAASASNPATTSSVASLKKLPKETFNKATPAPPNSFQAYLERLDDEKQISYLMLGASEVLTNFNVKRTHPYSYFFFKKKGYKQIFQPNKNIIVQEIKRRQPEAKPNQNNRSNDELMEMLRERWPLLEPDKRYIVQKEKDYCKLLMSVLNPKDVIEVDELTHLVANPSAQGLSVPMASTPPRKRSAGDMDLSSPAVAGGGGSSSSYYGNNNKRRASTSSMNGSSGHHYSSALETMLIHAANECADKLSYANLANTVETLKKERYELHMKKLPLTSVKHIASNNAQSIAFMDNRIKEITDSIVRYEAKMGVPHHPISVDV
mmetsp:Transcript_27467/g.66696  ORF Transcript_27467/g.66696 Transcript_27467/m.66696 type:complete len:364 (+) Transcript_27467:28-1119(+)